MRYSTEHKAEARNKIVTSAAALAKKQGFGATGVDALMGSAGMTGGAFYKHFSTKEDLLSEIVTAEIKRSTALLGTKADGVETPADILKKYLSLAHVASPQKGCVLPALSAEIGVASDSVKVGFEAEIKQLINELAPVMGDMDKTLATLSLCVGGVMLARGMKTPEAQQSLLDACLQGALAVLK